MKAGPTQEHMGCCIEPYHISAFDTFYHNGKKLSPKKFTVARVDGDCIEISPFNAITAVGECRYYLSTRRKYPFRNLRF